MSVAGPLASPARFVSYCSSPVVSSGAPPSLFLFPFWLVLISTPCQVRVHVCLGVDDANHRRLDNVYAFGCVD